MPLTEIGNLRLENKRLHEEALYWRETVKWILERLSNIQRSYEVQGIEAMDGGPNEVTRWIAEHRSEHDNDAPAPGIREITFGSPEWEALMGKDKEENSEYTEHRP